MSKKINATLLSPYAKPVLWLVLSVPLLGMITGALLDQLGANPAETLIRESGEWALRWLCVVLAITPLCQISGLAALQRFRRNIGVAVFFYSLLHMMCYAFFDKGFIISDIISDLIKRPFILVGFAALLLLIPLAATSFNRAIRTLGIKKWRALHRLVYGIAVLIIIHYWWLSSSKNKLDEVYVYGVIIAVLLAFRLWVGLQSLNKNSTKN